MKKAKVERTSYKWFLTNLDKLLHFGGKTKSVASDFTWVIEMTKVASLLRVDPLSWRSMSIVENKLIVTKTIKSLKWIVENDFVFHIVEILFCDSFGLNFRGVSHQNWVLWKVLLWYPCSIFAIWILTVGSFLYFVAATSYIARAG